MGIMPESGKEMLPGNVELLEIIGTKKGKNFHVLSGWSMDASTFPHTSSEPRSVPLGRAVEEHRRKGGECREQPGWVQQSNQVFTQTGPFKMMRLVVLICVN